MRKINLLRKILFCILLFLSFTVIACKDEQPDNPTNSDNGIIEGEYTPQVCPICSGEGTKAQPISYPAVSAHTPTTFVESSLKKTTHTIATGVDQHTYTFKLNNGNTSQVIVTEVNLKHAGIAVGTKDNSTSTIVKTTINNMADAYEKANKDRVVVAAVNADFFGGSTPVNALVKDGIVMKKSHNDNGSYEHNSKNSDIPASMPMLFGVSGQTAQIAPIIKNGTTQETIQSEFCYELTLTRDGISTTLATENQYVHNYYLENRTKIKIEERYNIDKEAFAAANSTVLKVKRHTKHGKYVHDEVVRIEKVSEIKSFKATEEFFYVMVPSKFDVTFKLGDIISNELTSADGTWAYYGQVIGARHALVIDGQIPDTVAKEITNSGLSTNIPRTAVGILSNGNVVLLSVEALRYGGKSSSSSDPYGLSLPQLADFMRYIGVYSGANFDGGGSTQLISRKSPTSAMEVLVRSSDTGSSNLSSSRIVVNAVLVYVKK